MDILACITNRRACRAISTEALAGEEIETIVGAGLLAPSCFNSQPWRIVVASGDTLAALKESLAESNAWARQSPAIIAVAARESDDCRQDEGRDYGLFDAGLCVMNMLTQATAMDIVAHPIAGFNAKKAKKALGIPGDYILITLVVLGKKGDNPKMTPSQAQAETAPRERKPSSALVFADTMVTS